MRVAWFIAVLLMAESGLAGADGYFADGNRLHDWSLAYKRAMTGHGSIDDDTSGAKLRFYILGAVDSLSVGRHLCFHEGTDTGQLVEMVVQYVDSHPTDWDLVGPLIVNKALREKFGCPRK